MSDKSTPSGSSKTEGLGIPALGGAAVAAVGAGLVVLSLFRGEGVPDWVRVTGIVLAAVGTYVFLSGGVERGHILEWVRAAALVLAVLLPVQWAIAQPFKIPSSSMEPTLHGKGNFVTDDRVLVNKWVYGVRVPFTNTRIWEGQDPQRWDIVVFHSAEKDAEHGTLVKRIVGLPGEDVLIRDGKVWVNGEALAPGDGLPEGQRYTADASMRYGVFDTPESMHVPEDHYLVLGDNSGNSRDGRYFGWLPKDHILGRVSNIWWPPSHWRDFTGFSGTWWGRLLLYGVPALLIGHEIWHFRRRRLEQRQSARA